MDYRKTLNLPQTKFPMKANLPQKEPELLKSWEEDKVYQRLKEQSRGQTKFILHDGPPYPNGNVHLGTALIRFSKILLLNINQRGDSSLLMSQAGTATGCRLSTW